MAARTRARAAGEDGAGAQRVWGGRVVMQSSADSMDADAGEHVRPAAGRSARVERAQRPPSAREKRAGSARKRADADADTFTANGECSTDAISVPKKAQANRNAKPTRRKRSVAQKRDAAKRTAEDAVFAQGEATARAGTRRSNTANSADIAHSLSDATPQTSRSSPGARQRRVPMQPRSAATPPPDRAARAVPALRHDAAGGDAPHVPPTCAPVSAHDVAKQYLHRSACVPIVGRESERGVIAAFVARFLGSAESGAAGPQALYVCGAPGTGKTALLDEELPRLLHGAPGVLVVRTNCLMASSAAAALEHMCAQLGAPSLAAGAAARSAIGRKTLFVVDEVDRLAADAGALAALFDLARLPHTAVVGIANALDLSVVRLQGAAQTLAFLPYGAEDVSRILRARLDAAGGAYSALRPGGQENAPPAGAPGAPGLRVSPGALELCARKCAVLGDVRRALEVMRAAVDAAHAEGAAVEVRHVLSALAAAFGAGAALATGAAGAARVRELNIHQKVVLAALGRRASQAAGARPTASELYAAYASFVDRTGALEGVSRAEFADVLANAEAAGVLQLVAGPAGRRGGAEARVALAVLPEDVAAGLADLPILAQ